MVFIPSNLFEGWTVTKRPKSPTSFSKRDRRQQQQVGQARIKNSQPTGQQQITTHTKHKTCRNIINTSTLKYKQLYKVKVIENKKIYSSKQAINLQIIRARK
jgi:hypothetical protein